MNSLCQSFLLYFSSPLSSNPYLSLSLPAFFSYSHSFASSLSLSNFNSLDRCTAISGHCHSSIEVSFFSFSLLRYPPYHNPLRFSTSLLSLHDFTLLCFSPLLFSYRFVSLDLTVLIRTYLKDGAKKC